MRTFVSGPAGRIIVIHLGKGELLLEGVRDELRELGVRNAVLLSAVGSLRKISMHVILDTTDLAQNEYRVIEEPIELGAMQGLVLNGEPHFHFVCSAPGGKQYTGHVEEGCEVQYLAEISLMELEDAALTRKLDEFGISYIDYA